MKYFKWFVVWPLKATAVIAVWFTIFALWPFCSGVGRGFVLFRRFGEFVGAAVCISVRILQDD